MECLNVWYLIAVHASLLSSERRWLGLWVANWTCWLPIIPKPMGKLNISIAALSRFSAVLSVLVRLTGILHCHLRILHSTQLKCCNGLYTCTCIVWSWTCVALGTCSAQSDWLSCCFCFGTKFHACSKLWSLWNVLWTRLLQQCSSKPTSIAGKVRWKLEDWPGLALSTWPSCQAWAGS